MALESRIRVLWERLDWTVYRLAKESGLSQTQIKDLEDGRNSNPGIQTLEKLAKALGVESGGLLGWHGGQTPKGLDHDDPRPEHTVEVPIRTVLVGGHQVTAEEMSAPATPIAFWPTCTDPAARSFACMESRCGRLCAAATSS